jgi:hypothetical protein
MIRVGMPMTVGELRQPNVRGRQKWICVVGMVGVVATRTLRWVIRSLGVKN